MSKQETAAAIVAECIEHGLTLPEQHAYVLATVEHETNNTFQPVREAYWLSESWRKANLRYYPWYGRGYVQLTWKANYAKYAALTGKALTQDPDLAMDLDVSRFVLCHGFKHGTFTGKKLENYVRAGKVDFRNARRCINGLDKADHIALLAKAWLTKLPAPAAPEAHLRHAVSILANGTPLEGYIEGGFSYGPMRAVCEALGLRLIVQVHAPPVPGIDAGQWPRALVDDADADRPPVIVPLRIDAGGVGWGKLILLLNVDDTDVAWLADARTVLLSREV